MPSKPLVAHFIIGFYRLWHGRLHLKGAGGLIRWAAPYTHGLQKFPLNLPEGQTVTVDFRDPAAFFWLNHLMGDRFQEDGLLDAIQSLANADAVIWDVGANSGVLSYRLAVWARNQRIRLHSFEPNPTVFSMACAALAPFPAVHVHNCALSDSNTVLTLNIPREGSACASLEAAATEPNRRVDVRCQRGDSLAEEDGIPMPDIIKIDTEGHELKVIAGLPKIIAEKKPLIFFENLSLTDEAILANTPAGYELYSVGNENGELRPGIHRTLGHNCLFAPISANLGAMQPLDKSQPTASPHSPT